MKTRRFLKIVWENFVVKQFAFFNVRIAKGPKTNIFTCKLCAWVIFIILFTRLLCDNSNTLTYEPRKGAKSNTFTCQLCDSTSHADWLFTIMIVTWTYEDLFRLVTNALKKARLGSSLHEHNLIADVVMKTRWFLKIVRENFVVNNLPFFTYQRAKDQHLHVQIVCMSYFYNSLY